jgi:hypothetical protein
MTTLWLNMVSLSRTGHFPSVVHQVTSAVSQNSMFSTALGSRTAYFYKLTTAEATEWSNEQFKKSMEETTGPGACPLLPSPSATSTTVPALHLCQHDTHQRSRPV